jgi:hypothetical protein
MAFFAPLIPYLAAAGTVVSTAQKYQADKYNSQVMANQQKFAIEGANAQETLVRRASREALGRQAAAFGGAGVGYGGSSETALDQSAINQELDALNTRYKGAITGYGYGEESKILKRQASDEAIGGGLLAGAQALKAAQKPPPFPPPYGYPSDNSGLG